jgi:hypothetical protein
MGCVYPIRAWARARDDVCCLPPPFPPPQPSTTLPPTHPPSPPPRPQAGVETIPGPVDVLMLALHVWSQGTAYVVGSNAVLDVFTLFVEWYTGVSPTATGWVEAEFFHPGSPTPSGVGSEARALLLSTELVAASQDYFIQRRFWSEGFRCAHVRVRTCVRWPVCAHVRALASCE